MLKWSSTSRSKLRPSPKTVPHPRQPNLTIRPTGIMQVCNKIDCVRNVMAHALKPNFVFLRKGRVHLNRREHQFSRLLAAEVCASAVVMLHIPCSEVVWRVLATHSISQFPLHFPCVTACHHISTGFYKGEVHPETWHEGTERGRGVDLRSDMGMNYSRWSKPRPGRLIRVKRLRLPLYRRLGRSES